MRLAFNVQQMKSCCGCSGARVGWGMRMRMGLQGSGGGGSSDGESEVTV